MVGMLLFADPFLQAEQTSETAKKTMSFYVEAVLMAENGALLLWRVPCEIGLGERRVGLL
jgi:hypothetical protein